MRRVRGLAGAVLAGACLPLFAEQGPYLHACPEGRASIKAARQVLGEAVAHDGLAPIAALRLRAGLSQGEVAAMTGIQQPMLSRIENGHVTDLQRSTMRLLADAFDVSLDQLDAALTETENLSRG